MKKSRFTEEQIAFALKQAELGIPVREVCRKVRHQRANVLRLAQVVRRSGTIETTPSEAVGG